MSKVTAAVVAVVVAGAAGLAVLYFLRKAAAKVGTRMVVTAEPPSSTGRGQEFPFAGYLEDINGNRLSGKTVELYADEAKVASGTTGADGGWGWMLHLDELSVIYASFAGDEAYAGCRRV